jgi:hypothetical protein
VSDVTLWRYLKKPDFAEAYRRQHFDGDIAAELGIAGAAHFAHAARTDLREDLVGSETSPGDRVVAPCHRMRQIFRFPALFRRPRLAFSNRATPAAAAIPP